LVKTTRLKRRCFRSSLRRTTIDKIIVTVLLIIGGAVASFAVFNGVYPAVERSSQAVSSAADAVNNRMASQIQIIQVAETGAEVDVWVKNVGTARIDGIENSDVFFGPDANIARISCASGNSTLPYWSYQLAGTDSLWAQAGTNKVMIHLSGAPAPGTYQLKIVIPNGIFDETSFSVE